MIRSCLTISLLIVLGACSKAQDYPHLTTITGRITVADSVDTTGDFSGFKLSIVLSDTTGRPDTLFKATTARDGRFRSQILVPAQGRYQITIGRYENQLATAIIVLGKEDSVRITAEFPNIEKTFLVESPENEAMRAYDRITRSYNRVLQFLQRGALSPDSIPDELMKWSKIYWELQDQYPTSLASRLGIIESFNILDGVNDSLMVARLTAMNQDETLMRSVSILSIGAMTREQGLTSTLDYLNKRKKASKDAVNRRYLDISRVQLLSDSLRIAEALKEMDAFDKEHTDQVSKGWSGMTRIDLTQLSLGKPMPSFTLRLEGGAKLPSDSLKGKPYILEIASLRDPIYQQQFTQMQGYFYVYNPMGLQFYTIPIEDNVVVIDGFYQDRDQLWPLAEAGYWREGDLMQRLNITSLPVRFLVDGEGKIVRKYAGNINLIVPDLQRVITPKTTN